MTERAKAPRHIIISVPPVGNLLSVPQLQASHLAVKRWPVSGTKFLMELLQSPAVLGVLLEFS